MTQPNLHIIGAGLAGLSAAYHAAKAGQWKVHLYEASPQAGGRCRSYFDEKLQTQLDNGNHILLGANSHALALIDTLGMRDHFRKGTGFHFRDSQTGRTWEIHSLWDLPFMQRKDRIALLRLLFLSKKSTTVSSYFAATPFYRYIITPLCISALNTEPERASAKLFAKLLKKLWLNRAQAHYYYWPLLNWGHSLITPLVNRLTEMGVSIHYETPLKHFDATEEHITHLHFAEQCVDIQEGDAAIFALSLPALHHVMPLLHLPQEHEGIINGHFLHSLGQDYEGKAVGLTGSTADWVFCKPHVVSTTTSASSRIKSEDSAELAASLWEDVCTALELGEEAAHIIPPYRIIHEKRATFAATPENCALRPKAQTAYNNLFFAGDCTANGLPATIEGAVLSGEYAAALATASLLP